MLPWPYIKPLDVSPFATEDMQRAPYIVIEPSLFLNLSGEEMQLIRRVTSNNETNKITSAMKYAELRIILNTSI